MCLIINQIIIVFPIKNLVIGTLIDNTFWVITRINLINKFSKNGEKKKRKRVSVGDSKQYQNKKKWKVDK